MTEHYQPREMTRSLLAALADMPVVVVTGMRQVGKSTLLLRQPELARRRFRTLDDFAQLEAAKRAPEAFIESDVPLIIDEAQKCPELLPAIKRAVDRERKKGWFLLSGSANFALLKDISESLAGRAVYLTLHPFTRREAAGAALKEPFLVRFFRSEGLPAPPHRAAGDPGGSPARRHASRVPGRHRRPAGVVQGL